DSDVARPSRAHRYLPYLVVRYPAMPDLRLPHLRLVGPLAECLEGVFQAGPLCRTAIDTRPIHVDNGLATCANSAFPSYSRSPLPLASYPPAVTAREMRTPCAFPSLSP